jgi:hypothetical protein
VLASGGSGNMKGMFAALLIDLVEITLRGAGIVASFLGLWMVGRRAALQAFNRLQSIVVGNIASVRFCLVDFLSLFVLLQIPLLILKLAIASLGRVTPTLLVCCGLYALIYVGLWWWGAATLSAAGVANAKRRGVFLALVLPASLLLIVLALPCVVLAPLAIASQPWLEAVLAAATMVAYGLLCWCYSRVVGWVLLPPASPAGRDGPPPLQFSRWGTVAPPSPSQVLDGTD